MLAAALEYRSRGWSVIPVAARSKEQLPFKWHPYTERLPTEQEIKGWWTLWPDANVAIVTGRVSNLVAIDVDAKRGGNIDDILNEHPTDYIVRTGGGGHHLYYSYPDDTDHVHNIDGPLFELKGDGARLLAPPSVNKFGKRYRWEPRGLYASALDGPPPSSAAVLTRIVRPQGEGHEEETHSQEAWLTTILRGVKEGDRNTAATRLAGYYLSKQMPEDVVFSLMNDWDASKNRPPLGPEVILSTIKSVGKTAKRRDRRGGQVTRIRVEDEGADEPFSLMSMDRYMAQFGDVPVKWVIEDWLPEKTIAMAVAPPGTYKTWLELALAVSVATGHPFLGKFPVQQSGPVIVVQQEDFHGQMAERLALVTSSMFQYGPLPDKNEDDFQFIPPPTVPIYLHPHRRLRFDDQIVVEGLEEKVARIRPSLVIIDPLYSTGPIDDYMVELVESLWPLKDMRDKYGCSFFLAHHSGKGKGDSTDREGGWGSQFLNAFIETGWQIRRKDVKDTAVIRRHFKVRADVEEETIKFDISTEHPYKFDVEFAKSNNGNGNGKHEPPDILALLDEFGPQTQAELAKRVGKDRSTLSRRLAKLEEARIVIKDNGTGKYRAIEDMMR
jgi:DNA-binding transcriptional ArsR family regulator